MPPIGLIIAAILGFGLGAFLATTAADEGTARIGGVFMFVAALAFVAGCERAWKERRRPE